MPGRSPRIGVLVVAYDTAATLASVLDRIPPSIRLRIEEIIVFDDDREDGADLVGFGRRHPADLPLTVARHPGNLGYGGIQKAGYRLAIEHGLDILVLLHGDRQYAPECMETLVEPLVRGEADAVFGSRETARNAGIRLHTYAGERILAAFQNGVIGTECSECRSGYRAYSVPALASLPFEQNSDDFAFDIQIILQIVDAGRRIVEVPIPVRYGDETGSVKPTRYAKVLAGAALRHRLHKMGFGTGSALEPVADYQLKESDDSSHGHITAWLAAFPPSHVLDLGCSGGRLGGRLSQLGHQVVGVEIESIPGAAERLDRLVIADLEQGIPPDAGTGYDVVVAGDVLEHVRSPEGLLREMHRVVRPGGAAVVSVPNFGHWYVRIRVALGLFDYDRRGILDRGHLRFFTRRSLTRLVKQSRWTISRTEYAGLPLDVLSEGGSTPVRLVGWIDRLLVRLWPTLFAYQLLFELHPVAGDPTAEIRLDTTPAAAVAR